MNTHNIHFEEEIRSPNYMDILVNQHSIFEPLKWYCIYSLTAKFLKNHTSQWQVHFSCTKHCNLLTVHPPVYFQRKHILSKGKQPPKIEMGTQKKDVDYSWLPEGTIQDMSKFTHTFR